jgi:predicted DNA binding CopG/RHH family protein
MTEKMRENRANAASVMITLPEYKQVYSTDAQQHQPVDTFTVNQMPTHIHTYLYAWGTDETVSMELGSNELMSIP